MAVAGTRPRSVALVNTLFGFTFGTLFQSVLVTTPTQSTVLEGSLVAGLLAAFLVLTSPIDFLLKMCLSYRVSHSQRSSFNELAQVTANKEPRKSLKSAAMRVYADSFFGFERSEMVSMIYLSTILIAVVLSSAFNVATLPVNHQYLWLIDEILLVGLAVLVLKFDRTFSRAPGIMDTIAAYSVVLRQPLKANSDDIQALRNSLSEGNWLEANGWLARIQLTGKEEQPSRPSPSTAGQLPQTVTAPRRTNLQAQLELRPVAIGSVALVTRLNNEGTLGAVHLNISTKYSPSVRKVKDIDVRAIPARGRVVEVLDSYVPTQLLSETKDLVIEIRVTFSDELGNPGEPVTQSTNARQLIDDMNRAIERKNLGLD